MVHMQNPFSFPVLFKSWHACFFNWWENLGFSYWVWRRCFQWASTFKISNSYALPALRIQQLIVSSRDLLLLIEFQFNSTDFLLLLLFFMNVQQIYTSLWTTTLLNLFILSWWWWLYCRDYLAEANWGSLFFFTVIIIR